MFAPGYFSPSYFAPTYFPPGDLVTDESGGAKKVRERKSKRKDDLIDGLKAFYGEPEAIEKAPEVPAIEEALEPFETVELETIPEDYLTFEQQLGELEAQVEMSPETRAELEQTQDIGLILAIIEAID